MSATDPTRPAMAENGPARAAGREDADPPAARSVPPPDPEPVPPPEPDAADCCGEGCIRCVYDRYDEALERYRLALAAWRERQR